MKNPSTRSSSIVPLVTALSLLLVGAIVTPAIQGETVKAGTGQAFGTEVTLLGAVQSDKSAVIGMGCSIEPTFNENAVAGLDLAPVLTAGAVQTTARRTQFSDGTVRARTTAEINGVDILGGVISASVIFANSVTEDTPTGFKTRGTGSQLANLSVLGIPIESEPPPNTTLDLLGFGFVTLNERTVSIRQHGANFRVRMIHVVVDEPNVLVPVGTEITIGSALSGIQNTEVFLGGQAHSGWVRIEGEPIVNKIQRQAMPCGGTGGEVRKRVGLGVSLPLVLEVGAVENAAKGIANPIAVDAWTKSTSANVDLLDGLVSADTIIAKTRIVGPPGAIERRPGASRFIGLQVAGFPEINDDIQFNTQLDILGLGDLWLRRRIFDDENDGVTVRMIELDVLENNVLELPIGTNFQLSVAGVRTREPGT